MAMKNGIIVFMRDQVIPGKKMLDIRVTNPFPLISLEDEVHLLGPNRESEVLLNYDHISIPPDLKLHITGRNEHIFFNMTPVWAALDSDRPEFVHYFTIVGLPAGRARELVPDGERRTWQEGMVISPFHDADFNDSTRLFVDFFLHNAPTETEDIARYPLVMNGMRLASDQQGPVIGPYPFADLQRRRKPDENIELSLRFGYVNLSDDAESTYIWCPLDIYQRRPITK